MLVGALLIAGAGFGVNHIFAGEKSPALTEKEAVQKAEERYPGTVKEIELDNSGSRHVYEIELHGAGGEYEIKMDANTGEILKVEQSRIADPSAREDDSRKDEEIADYRVSEKPDKEPKHIGFEKAKKIASKKFDGNIEEIELDKDDGRWIYEVEMKKGKRKAEIEIDAYTGKILFMSLENDDD